MRIALSFFIGLLALTFASSVEARPRHKGYYQHQGYGYYAKVRVRQVRNYAAVECNQQGCGDAQQMRPAFTERRSPLRFTARARAASGIKTAARNPGVLPSFPSSDLSSRARAYVGTNPTGWRSVWCGRFMAMIAPGAAARISNPNAARSWAELPATSARVGAIAVMSRGRCRSNGFCPGHVGVVSGFQNGNPIIISGNNAGRVREAPYPASGVLKYVSG